MRIVGKNSYFLQEMCDRHATKNPTEIASLIKQEMQDTIFLPGKKILPLDEFVKEYAIYFTPFHEEQDLRILAQAYIDGLQKAQQEGRFFSREGAVTKDDEIKIREFLLRHGFEVEKGLKDGTLSSAGSFDKLVHPIKPSLGESLSKRLRLH